MKITKVLCADSEPAEALLKRAKHFSLTSQEREQPPAHLTATDGSVYDNALTLSKPLEVGDVLVDEKGSFYVVDPAKEDIIEVRGDIDLMREAVHALLARGIRVAPVGNEGFSIVANPQLEEIIQSAGLHITHVNAAFIPLQFHHCCHHHDDECSCGCHDHHHDDECSCGCHDHHHDDKCSCGCHDHHHDDECSCGCHDHHHDDECSCGCHDHHHDDDKCTCGCHDHHHDDECSCGCHDHHHDDECCNAKK